MNGIAETAILIVYFFWLSTLTFLFFRFYSYYTRIFKNENRESLMSILDSITQKEEKNREAIESISNLCEQLKKDGSLHIQKVGDTKTPLKPQQISCHLKIQLLI